MFHAVLVGIDGSGQTEGVVTIAADLARACGASLHILCVVDPAYFLSEPDGRRPSEADEADYPAAAMERESADDLVHRVLLGLREQKLSAEGSVVQGEAVERILETASTLGCDAIVLGHRHLSWLGRLTERSVCREVLEKASVPVLVVPSPDKAHPASSIRQG
ncbi:universal stress protein [Nitrospirillum amazonense]|uniref:universal stress protein n=1 Tax=Nitrospirillum amazonense TaxID=28077 RepID=UPI0024121928|nr:universal stress protein [Nitrospirillum amazonense]MDG3439105.1 universal stress protein [Nitrospirillum amazonense]